MQVREDYASVGDFVKILVFEAAVHMKDGKKHAVDPEQSKNGDGALWRLNVSLPNH
ncbi:hypothetical protein MNEG_5912 [Monoraphidium neglectum]|uniref:Uncharacterized protein n=1 Tax=Monoraphidium neglectum TaxID=145388 RepID=A0A0D2JSU0_9CHLO|nr:hypothetical protein MNEG_5912 [Monoraphidium neglectum]KIZ02048.1 hypothetical protein MNEG_5912 [Monoraphidium neglectum]|eukprot:XP_013901067.1 hypothetical protein MNEG_5912 [Monoraphidium neglectum]